MIISTASNVVIMPTNNDFKRKILKFRNPKTSDFFENYFLTEYFLS